jgi:thiol-disulfide isomerase/thioredoxin
MKSVVQQSSQMVSYLRSVITNQRYLMIFFLTFLFVVVAVYAYRRVIKPRMERVYAYNDKQVEGFNSSSETGSGSALDEIKQGHADLYYFYTEWCPHCKKAKPVMEELSKYLEERNNEIHGVKVNFIQVNCEKDKQLANKFEVEGYPTIKMSYNGRVIEYDAKPDIDVLKEFLDTSLSQ